MWEFPKNQGAPRWTPNSRALIGRTLQKEDYRKSHLEAPKLACPGQELQQVLEEGLNRSSETSHASTQSNQNVDLWQRAV